MIESGEPKPILPAARQSRIRRVSRIASEFDFVGHIEYRHVYSRIGGAQYWTGPSADTDLLVVFAEAFERDANVDDFSLEAIIAHECGHQKLIRIPELRDILDKFPIEPFEEVLASLVGSILLENSFSMNCTVLGADMPI